MSACPSCCPSTPLRSRPGGQRRGTRGFARQSHCRALAQAAFWRQEQTWCEPARSWVALGTTARVRVPQITPRGSGAPADDSPLTFRTSRVWKGSRSAVRACCEAGAVVCSWRPSWRLAASWASSRARTRSNWGSSRAFTFQIKKYKLFHPYFRDGRTESTRRAGAAAHHRTCKRRAYGAV